ncbi:MAG: hypothetical protein MK180_11820 [Rhodobacteraceae bacterium]|nr:hypothetical protein [Paracoccaceae bacterium]
MHHYSLPRGGAPVGLLSELDCVEAGAVIYLRLWSEGPDEQAMVCQEFDALLGYEKGRNATESFGKLCEICARHCRRPLLRHGLNCKCLGADEACFANFVGYATDGEREDAFLLAATMVRPNMASALVTLAQDFGLALKSMARSHGRPIEALDADQPQTRTLH